MKTSTKLPVRYLYWTKSKGIGGKLKSPEDFAVKERIGAEFFSRFRRGKNVEASEGKYSLCLLTKKGMTTEEAVEKVASHLSVPRKNISYAGLKDKFSVSSQYITVKGHAVGMDEDGLKLEFIRFTDKKISVGDLKSNLFEVTLHCNPEKIGKALDELKKGFPNYFGLQRFGAGMNNHVIGKFLVERNFGGALGLINSIYKRGYGSIHGVPKERLKFFIHAYQSWIFNETLSSLVRKRRYYRGYIPLVGCSTKNVKIIELAGIPADRKNFCIPELGIRVTGSMRKAFIKPRGIKYIRAGDGVKLVFELPKGSYGTMLLRELEK